MLEKRKIPNYLTRWLKCYLENRSTQLRYQDVTTNTYQIQCGIPQGSPLSPLLFVLFKADLIQDMDISNTNYALLSDCLVTGYMDDITIIAKGTEILQNYHLVQQRLDKLISRAKTLGLEFDAANKCHHKKRTISRQIASSNTSITMNNHPIQPQSTIKVLGVTFDDRLNFKTHIMNKTKSFSKAAGILHHIAKKFPIESQKILYLQTVRPAIEYASEIWSPKFRQH